jgi:hypothetical protein
MRRAQGTRDSTLGRRVSLQVKGRGQATRKIGMWRFCYLGVHRCPARMH